MYLVLEDRLAQLLPDEKVQAKAHALTCKNISDDLNNGTSGTLFLTSYRVLFQPFQSSVSKHASAWLFFVSYVIGLAIFTHSYGACAAWEGTA